MLTHILGAMFRRKLRNKLIHGAYKFKHEPVHIPKEFKPAYERKSKNTLGITDEEIQREFDILDRGVGRIK